MASAKLTRTYGSAGNRKTYTLSVWVKFSGFAAATLANIGPFSGDNEFRLTRNASGTLEFYDYGSSAYKFRYRTERKLRDCSGWYHIVCAVDTTQGTSGNRVKIYVNGVQETSFDVSTAPSQNLDTAWGVANNYTLGSAENGNYTDGLITHFNYVDGTALAPTSFGQSDSNGVWIPKPSPSVTYGTNGFFLKMNNSANMGLDSGGGSNNWTTSGTITQAKDTPSNVFATMNPLDNYWQGSTFSNGNNTIVTGSTSQTFNTSTLLMTSGKYYVEAKPTVGSATLDIGITGEPAVNASQTLASRGTGYAYVSSGSVSNNGSSVGGTWSTYTNNDIIGIAVDLDNNKLYFSKNGTWQNSGDPTSGSTGTGAVSITDPLNLSGENKMYAYAFAMNETWNDNTRTVQWNFGNGYFGTTAVTSAGTNASGNGIFEYDVPTGYTALSTKGLDS